MKLIIRDEQMSVIEAVAEESFVRRIALHLLERYSKAVVTLPDKSQSTVEELPEETFFSLIRNAVSRARSHGLTFESAIAGFTAVMFAVSPNFDTHRLSQVLLNDEEIDPNLRLDELLNVLTDKNWESIKEDYDPAAWEAAEEKPDTEQAEQQKQPEEVKEDPKEIQYNSTIYNQ